MKKSTRLKTLFNRPEIFVLPGTCNAFEAMIVDQTGFEACYMSGGRTSAGLVGLPDAGLMTMSEIVLNARYMANSIEIPLLSDADTGYGNALNTWRTVREFIQAGVAGIHLEDQVSPKRCGFTAGKQVVEVEEMVSKLRAACDVRDDLDPDFVIAGRTDAFGAVGGSLDEACRRSVAYREAGADVSFADGLKTMEHVRIYCERVPPPIMVNLFGIPFEDLPSHEEMQRMGISCAFYPALVYMNIFLPLVWEFMNDFRDRQVEAYKEWNRWERDFPRKYPPAPSFFEISGFAKIRKLEEKYLSPIELEKYSKSSGLTFE